MRFLLVAVPFFLFHAHNNSIAEEQITVAGELARLRSADHLFRPQSHQLVQYSGFHREGGNPDRLYCLYEENGWRVVADHQGPGVVSRIWSTHDTNWRDIRVEVDGQTIFSGTADRFFAQERPPFVAPLSEVRNNVSGRVTAEQEAPGRKEWAVSYVPIPFKKRFRYLQRDKVYANINVKALAPDTKIESFLDADWDALQPDFEQTAAVWRRMDLLGTEPTNCRQIDRTVTLLAAANASSTATVVTELPGPGIIRGVRVRMQDVEQRKHVQLQFRWDDDQQPSVVAPLGLGFGSRSHRTLTLGQATDGWHVCLLPMPFRERATVSWSSSATTETECDLQLLVEKHVALSADVLYLRSHLNHGQINKGADFERPDLPLVDFFYHNGYTAFDQQGSGHIVAYMDLFDCQPELDEHIFIDDERTFPDNSWNGTGHEDLFDMAWGHSPVSAPMTSGGSQEFEEVNVKLFWNDPLTFRKAIRFNWEWAFRFGVKPPRDARFASIVYWYGPQR